MIYFITKAGKTYTLLTFINTWGKSIRNVVTILPVEKLVRSRTFSPGTYVLTDYDRLNEKQMTILKKIWSEFEKHPDNIRLVNHPERSMNRVQLLDKLFAAGINPFRCIPLNELPDNLKFPVFIRKGRDHFGKITGLIRDKTSLGKTIRDIQKEGFRDDEILVTEFTDTSDEHGVFRKYSAFRAGDKIIPRHIFFSRNWMIKGADLVTREMLEEEKKYLKTNPHKNELHKIFQLAGMQYGRIDYGMSNGQPVVWEINPNPMIASSSSLKKPHRKPAHNLFVSDFSSAFRSMDSPAESGLVDNPYLKNGLEKEIRKNFPFSEALYRFSNMFQWVKTILLFRAYTIRNLLIR